MIDYYQEIDFSGAVFVIVDGIIVERVLGELCREHAETTTTPNGVVPKHHTRQSKGWIYKASVYASLECAELAKSDDVAEGDYSGIIEPADRFELWSWGHGGQFPTKLASFDKKNEAEHALLVTYYNEILRKADPVIYQTNAQANAEINWQEAEREA